MTTCGTAPELAKDSAKLVSWTQVPSIDDSDGGSAASAEAGIIRFPSSHSRATMCLRTIRDRAGRSGGAPHTEFRMRYSRRSFPTFPPLVPCRGLGRRVRARGQRHREISASAPLP